MNSQRNTSGSIHIARHADIAKMPRWQAKDRLSQKMGPHATVYLINGDRYIGDWKDNKRHVPMDRAQTTTGATQPTQQQQQQRSRPQQAQSQTHSDSEEYHSENTTSSTVNAPDEESLFVDDKQTKGAKMGDEMLVRLRKVYAGAWYGDKRHGVGTYFYDDGSVYEGHWEIDMKEGWGRMMYANGSVYEGEWHHENRHGQGILLLVTDGFQKRHGTANGDRYEGMWLNNEKEGPGKFVYRSKRQVYEGEWTKDMPKCGTLRDLPPLPGQREKLYPIPS
eukprot:jgi/Hompol1/2028/HPOL_005073-RA